jgi:hypothetical protein
LAQGLACHHLPARAALGGRRTRRQRTAMDHIQLCVFCVTVIGPSEASVLRAFQHGHHLVVHFLQPASPGRPSRHRISTNFSSADLGCTAILDRGAKTGWDGPCEKRAERVLLPEFCYFFPQHVTRSQETLRVTFQLNIKSTPMSPHQYVYAVPCCLAYKAYQASHRTFQGCGAFRRLLLLILPNRIARRMFHGTPPILIEGHSESRAAHRLDSSSILHVHRISSCDEHMFYVLCLQLLLTV